MSHRPAPFHTYALTGWREKMLAAAQAMPVNWMGRRLALICRKLVLKSGGGPVIDAAVGPISMRFHTNDNVSERKFLFTPQFFDVVERRVMADHLKNQSIFVDIGANAGIYSLWAAHLGARVVAVEPNPVMAERLIFNAMVNQAWGRIKLEKCGVSDQSGIFRLYLDDTNLGGSSLVDRGGTQTIDVPCYTLEHVLQKNDVGCVDMMKIDIEGAEDKALIPFFKTAPQTLWPHCLILENSPNQWHGDLLGTLGELGYTLLHQTRMNLIYQQS